MGQNLRVLDLLIFLVLNMFLVFFCFKSTATYLGWENHPF